jgi:hypothetical protein
MSSGGDGPPAGLARIADFSVRFGLPAAAALALLSIVTAPGDDPDRELHVIAPEAADPGDSLPVRAHLYTGLRRPEGPRLSAVTGRARLRTAGGRVLADAPLAAGHGPSMETLLRIPEATAAPLQVEVEVQTEGGPLVVGRPLRVGVSGAADAPTPRALRLPARFSAGPVRAVGDAPPPDSLTLRVAGGACVPEAPCTLLLHVGEPAASVRVRSNAAVTPLPASARPSAPTAGVVALGVRIRGPEASLDLVAEREGQPVATRSFRLPVALGSRALSLPEGPLFDPPAGPRLKLLGAEGSCIVDVWRAGRWLRSLSLDDCGGGGQLQPGLPAGIWRLQVRRDPFGSGSAAVATLWVRDPTRSPDADLLRLAAAARRRAPDDRLAAALLARPSRAGPERALAVRYLLAILDAGLWPLPAAVSSRPVALARLAAHRADVRRMALVVIVLSGLALSGWLASRGLAASAEAGRILAAAGESARDQGRNRLRMRLRVASAVLSLLLAFGAIALYVFARGSGLP